MTPRALSLAVALLATAGALTAGAQPASKRRPPAAAPPPAPAGPTNLRSFVGTEHAARLVRSTDPDERIRGIERASSLGTPESIALLVESLDRSPQLKADTRALLAMARGLARFADQERARTGLLAIVGSSNPGLAARAASTSRTSGDGLDEGDPIARAELARHTAALALARFGGDRALEALYGAARGGGIGQGAALAALQVHPPREPGFFGTTGAALPVPVVRLLGTLGDLRALDLLHAAARSSDVAIRCAALVSLAELGDERASLLARAAIVESDVRLRAASGEVFILLAAPERFKATAALVADEATTAVGIHMAERVHGPEITKLVAARATDHPDRAIRAASIRALGRSPDPGAATALVGPKLLGDPELVHHALVALARSPAPNASALIGGLLPTRFATLAARAYVVRALVRGERVGSSDDAMARLAASRQPAERAVGVLARVALGDADADELLSDRDPRVRRAAATGALARLPSRSIERSLLRHLATETDPTTIQVLAIGLLGGDPDGTVKTSTLVERAESGGGDAAIATLAFVRRADDKAARKVGQLLLSKDPLVRAHAARGLGVAALSDATGRLADAYTNETDPEVRRAIVTALAARTADASSPTRRATLRLAAELDPDGAVRQAARRALAGAEVPFGAAGTADVAWLRVTLEGGAPPGDAYAGALVRSDGLAVPLVFDDEGYALVPGVPPGEARLVLAPKLPSDKTRATP